MKIVKIYIYCLDQIMVNFRLLSVQIIVNVLCHSCGGLITLYTGPDHFLFHTTDVCQTEKLTEHPNEYNSSL